MIMMTPEQAHIVYQMTSSQGWRTILDILQVDRDEIERSLVNPKVGWDFTQYYRGALAKIMDVFDLNKFAFNVINEAAQSQQRKDEENEEF
jgi:hypothetical protein